jgi:hypothetical protein
MVALLLNIDFHTRVQVVRMEHVKDFVLVRRSQIMIVGLAPDGHANRLFLGDFRSVVLWLIPITQPHVILHAALAIRAVFPMNLNRLANNGLVRPVRLLDAVLTKHPT